MAYFAKLDEDNIVEGVQVVSDSEVPTEEAGINFLKQLHGSDTNWKQTFREGGTRKQYGNIGYTYDASKDVFIEPKLYASWTLNADNEWIAPVTYPDDGKNYAWNDDTQAWDEHNPIPPELR